MNKYRSGLFLCK